MLSKYYRDAIAMHVKQYRGFEKRLEAYRTAIEHLETYGMLDADELGLGCKKDANMHHLLQKHSMTLGNCKLFWNDLVRLAHSGKEYADYIARYYPDMGIPDDPVVLDELQPVPVFQFLARRGLLKKMVIN